MSTERGIEMKNTHYLCVLIVTLHSSQFTHKCELSCILCRFLSFRHYRVPSLGVTIAIPVTMQVTAHIGSTLTLCHLCSLCMKWLVGVEVGGLPVPQCHLRTWEALVIELRN
jgi:hypothetical protein